MVSNIKDLHQLLQQNVLNIQIPVALTATQEAQGDFSFLYFLSFVKDILATYKISGMSNYFNSMDSEERLKSMMNWFVDTILFIVTGYCVAEQIKKHREAKGQNG